MFHLYGGINVKFLHLILFLRKFKC